MTQSADDYYVKVSDLCDGKLQNKLYQNSSTLLPDVSTNENFSDGKTQTYNMLKNCNFLNTSSPAAEFASTQKYDHNGVSYCGFIGTICQYKILFTDCYQNICDGLSQFGKLPILRNIMISSSIQIDTSRFWVWLSLSDSSGLWYRENKSYPISKVLPIFSNN